ncbi:hypothetical protein RJT34_21587 [Clitoria ternatea]|uniref:Uncharacterized protein n=1 Tax=Clitoria ternatea TaxID=43366 RepID=A0AAN9IUE2_CLITE
MDGKKLVSIISEAGSGGVYRQTELAMTVSCLCSSNIEVFPRYDTLLQVGWPVLKGSTWGERGVKLEWALPWNTSREVCARNTNMANATAIVFVKMDMLVMVLLIDQDVYRKFFVQLKPHP